MKILAILLFAALIVIGGVVYRLAHNKGRQSVNIEDRRRLLFHPAAIIALVGGGRAVMFTEQHGLEEDYYPVLSERAISRFHIPVLVRVEHFQSIARALIGLAPDGADKRKLDNYVEEGELLQRAAVIRDDPWLDLAEKEAEPEKIH